MGMQALVLVGGLGTRLRPAIGSTPKAMAMVAGRPFLEYLILQLRRDGIRDVVMLTGYGADAVKQYFRDGRAWGVSIAYSQEPAPLGTAGALRHALPNLEGRQFLVMNGDSFFDISLLDLIAVHAAAPPADPAAGTLALARSRETRRFGTVEVDAADRVTAFREKADRAGGGLINAGICVLERAIIEDIPAGRAVSLELEVFPGLLHGALRGVEFRGTFLDIGIPAAYEALRADPTPVLAVV
jgi:NDP-sugar pyrophosphorylase family protein